MGAQAAIAHARLNENVPQHVSVNRASAKRFNTTTKGCIFNVKMKAYRSWSGPWLQHVSQTFSQLISQPASCVVM